MATVRFCLRVFACAGLMGLAMIGTAGAQSQTTAPPAAQPAQAQPAPDAQTMTIFGKRRQRGNPQAARIDPNVSSTCAFMNDYSASGDDMVQDYLNDYSAHDNTSNDLPGTDETDPNTPGTHFNDTSPSGDAAHNTSVTLPGMVGPDGQTTERTGACNPSDKNFAAGRNYIARNDRSLRDAFAAFDAKDYPKALDLFKKSFDKMGYDTAALMEGKMYLAGLGTTRDTKQGIFWLKKVAEARFGPGDRQRFDPANPDYMEPRSDAAMLLGRIYMIGWDVPKTPKEAKRWYMKADEFGFIPGTHLVGRIFSTGYGGERNMPKAVTYLKKAGEVGYARSEYELGVIYYDGDDGVPQDKKLAAQWLLEAAKRGDADALYAVGRMYDLGDVLPEDVDKAIVYYKEAALKGQPEAQNALGVFFYNGEVVAKDLVIARKWFEMAARNGEPEAMFNLAVMLAHGEGGAKDLAVAYVWFRLAEQSGMEKGGAAAREIEAKMSPDERARADKVLNPAK